MNKFKIGDKVRVINKRCTFYNEIAIFWGYIGNGLVWVKLDVDEFPDCLRERDIKPIGNNPQGYKGPRDKKGRFVGGLTIEKMRAIYNSVNEYHKEKKDVIWEVEDLLADYGLGKISAEKLIKQLVRIITKLS